MNRHGRTETFLRHGTNRTEPEPPCDLQCEFERCLLQAPPWCQDVCLRGVAGWELSWGEHVIYVALCFRAELWCCEAKTLVRSVWSDAQHMSGRTFAFVSHSILRQLGLLEIFECSYWAEFLSTGVSVLDFYKEYIRKELIARSHTNWRKLRQSRCSSCQHLLAQHTPISASSRLLEADKLSSLYAVDAWEKLRLGLVSHVLVYHVEGKRHVVCALCHGPDTTIAHTLSSCLHTTFCRVDFLAKIDRDWSLTLHSALPGDWPMEIFNPHMSVNRLPHVVEFCQEIVRLLENNIMVDWR